MKYKVGEEIHKLKPRNACKIFHKPNEIHAPTK